MAPHSNSTADLGHLIMSMIIQKSMNPDFYIYQGRRPRLNNPTYNSSHVDQTCFSIYHGGIITSRRAQSNNNSINNDLKQQFSRSRGASQLSSIGSSLLKIEDKDVYNRQRSKFDIISMQPVGHDETIKKYPKFTLEDKDINYLRKMKKLAKDEEKQGTAGDNGNKSHRYAAEESSNGTIAGRHSFKLDSNKAALELWESYQGKPPVKPHFCAKMLNHADQFRSII